MVMGVPMDESEGKSQYVLNLEFDPKIDWKDVCFTRGYAF